jgi:hypothetical protein
MVVVKMILRGFVVFLLGLWGLKHFLAFVVFLDVEFEL